MDWNRVYSKIIENAKNREKDESLNYEIHHIVPRSIGGLDEDSNLVELTLREHFFCRVLLCSMFEEGSFEKKKMIWAFNFMSGCSKYENSKNYEKLKDQARIVQRNDRIGKTLSEETKRKISEAHKGKIYTEDYLKKLSKSTMGINKGRKHSAETNEKNRIAQLGRKHSEETKKKMRENSGVHHTKGIKKSREAVEKMRQSLINRSLEEKSIVAEMIKAKQKIGEKFLIWRIDDPETTYEFDCFADAHRFAKIGNVGKILSGKIKRSGNWTARWV